MLVGSGEQFEIPDKCPINCRYHHMSVFKGEKCGICPVFNCHKSLDGFCMVEAKDYNSALADLWSKWFQTDMKEDLWHTANL